MRALASRARNGSRSWKLLPGSVVASGSALALSQATTSAPTFTSPSRPYAAGAKGRLETAAAPAKALARRNICRRLNMALSLRCFFGFVCRLVCVGGAQPVELQVAEPAGGIAGDDQLDLDPLGILGNVDRDRLTGPAKRTHRSTRLHRQDRILVLAPDDDDELRAGPDARRLGPHA